MPNLLAQRTLRRAGFLVAIALLGAVGLATVWSFGRASDSYAWVEHTYRVIITLQDYRASLRTAESAARGYRLTGLPAMRDEFAAVTPEIGGQLRVLVGLVADNPEQQDRAHQLQALTRERLQTAQGLIQGHGDATGALLAGSRQTAHIESVAATMLREEERLLAQRRAESAALARRLVGFTVGGTALAILLLAMLMLDLQREIRRSRVLEAQARDAARGLETSLAKLHDVSEQRGALGRYASLLQSCADIDEAMRVTGQVVAELLPGVGGRCFLLRASQDLAETAIAFGEPAAKSAALLHPSECWALRRGQPYRVDEARTGVACTHVEATRAADGAWTLCVPLTAQGAALGLLYVSGCAQTDRVQAQALVESVAEQLGLALVNLQLREKLRLQSLRDPLTGLFNRRYLDESLQREVSRCQRRQLPLAVLMLDVDHFKSFNDTHGHAAGDALLTAIAHALQANTRGEDLVCRYGGEEFTIVLVEASREDALRRAEQIRAAVAAVSVQYLRQTLGPRTVSIGLAMLPEHGQTPAALLQQADAALYRAKAEGRDRVACA